MGVWLHSGQWGARSSCWAGLLGEVSWASGGNTTGFVLLETPWAPFCFALRWKPRGRSFEQGHGRCRHLDWNRQITYLELCSTSALPGICGNIVSFFPPILSNTFPFYRWKISEQGNGFLWYMYCQYYFGCSNSKSLRKEKGIYRFKYIQSMGTDKSLSAGEWKNWGTVLRCIIISQQYKGKNYGCANNMDEPQMHDAKWKVRLRKATYCVISFLWHSGKGKTLQTENRSVVAKGLRGKGERGIWSSDRTVLNLGFFWILVVMLNYYMYLSELTEPHSKKGEFYCMYIML